MEKFIPEHDDLILKYNRLEEEKQQILRTLKELEVTVILNNNKLEIFKNA